VNMFAYPKQQQGEIKPRKANKVRGS
jgi:hypothetical protein